MSGTRNADVEIIEALANPNSKWDGKPCTKTAVKFISTAGRQNTDPRTDANPLLHAINAVAAAGLQLVIAPLPPNRVATNGCIVKEYT